MMKYLVLATIFWISSVFSADTVLTFHAVPSSRTLQQGDTAVLTFRATVSKEWHIWGHAIKDPYLIATRLEVLSLSGAETLGVLYPIGTTKTLMGLTEPLYEGTVDFNLKLHKLDSGVVSGKVVLHYQGCNDALCLPPATSALSFSVPVQGADAPASEEGIAGRLANASLLSALFFLFLMGLGLCLTPCVYPVIPITLGFFTAQAAGNRGKSVALAALYALGIALTYSLLGTTAALSGKILGAALQHPAVLLGLALVFVVLALSMFGLFEFRLPAALNQLGVGRRGALGALLMGLIVGIVAAPCVGPVTAGLLLYVAEKQDPLLGFLYFFALSLGLGTPFFFLGLFSGSVRKLPGSGGWLNWVKKFFGFVLLGMAIYYMRPLIGTAWVNRLLALLSLLAALYLGLLEKSMVQSRRFTRFQKGFALLLLVLSYLTVGKELLGSHASLAATVRQEAHHPRLNMALFETLRKSGKPFAIDFRADWCAPCRAFEKEVLADPAVAQVLSGFAFYQGDLTKDNDPETEQLVVQFKITGVPTLLFYDAKGHEVVRQVGGMEKDSFIKLIQELKASEDSR